MNFLLTLSIMAQGGEKEREKERCRLGLAKTVGFKFLISTAKVAEDSRFMTTGPINYPTQWLQHTGHLIFRTCD